MCKSAVLMSKKDYALGDSLRSICRNLKVNLVYALSFPEMLHYVITLHPEVIFYDAEGIEFRYDIYKDFLDSRIFELPKIIIFSTDVEKMKFSDDNIYIVDKRNYTDEVTKILSNIEERKAEKIEKEKLDEYRTKTSKILSELGITTKYLGYEYIKELVLDIICDKRMLKSFNTKLYPKLAIKYNTKINNIERNIRNAINVAVENCKNKELFNKICGKVNSETGPSNKQFVTWLVEEVS